MSAPNPRKRAAPGASPMVPLPPRAQQPHSSENAVGDPMLQWNAADTTGFVEPFPGANNYGFAPAQPVYNQAVATPSTSLTRRQTNNALVPTNPRANFDSSVDHWTGFGEGASLVPQNNGEEFVPQDNIEVLEEMAQKAQREAKGKRKGIPPFVQKLSSFLEERKNEDLIRWSEKGDSFIVLDEDEFAKTLIPELFKHNNYASFVRQLNMYGFHKRVGLSDNSMRASERKNKSPSEYSNPFFRRGHPNLLWLINKPKSGKNSKNRGKSAEGDGDSDDEVGNDEAVGQGQAHASSSVPAGRSLPSTESQPLPKKEMSVIRDELHTLREQQKQILNAINRLQRNNNDLYNQALMFQSQHDRHQNSINAILNFLANVFRKTLEDQGNSQSVSDIISSMITNPGQQHTHQGSVVDLGDFFQNQMDGSNPLGGGPPKRARGLLPPIPNQEAPQASRSPSTGSTSYRPISGHRSEMGHVTELGDGSPAETPPSLRQELENNPHERMMKIINDHNATNSSELDLPKAAELVANAPNTLNNDQRSKLVDFMAGQTTSSSSSTPIPATSGSPSQGPSGSSVPKQSPPPADGGAAPSLSPIMRSPPMPVPSLHQISTNQDDLAHLQRLQHEQDAKISELSDMLGPLSPSGRIPGLADDSDPSYFEPPNVDLDQYFDSNAFLNDSTFGDGTDFNFNLDADNGHNGFGAGRTDGLNQEAPSPTGTEEIPRTDFDVDDKSNHDNKRRRVD